MKNPMPDGYISSGLPEELVQQMVENGWTTSMEIFVSEDFNLIQLRVKMVMSTLL